MNANLNLLDTLTIFHGSHGSHGACKAGEYSARAIINLAVTGIPDDETPAGLTPHLAILPGLGDGPWRDDAHRTAVIRPFLRRLAVQRADAERDRRISYALADYAVHTCAAEALEAAGMASAGVTLRALAPIVDRASGDAAARASARASAASYASYAASYAAARAAARASYAAAYAAADAPAAASISTASAATATASAATAADVCERYACALLTIVVETP